MQAYTVILLYPNFLTEDFGGDTYIDSAEAEDGFAAARRVQEMAASANGGAAEPEDFRVIAVFRGDVPLELDATQFEISRGG